jgi:glycine/serine hydroxymethyltransferase
MREPEMEYIGELINEVLNNPGKEDVSRSIARRVEELCMRFPLYPELLRQ